mgnify:CR=1 FL=1
MWGKTVGTNCTAASALPLWYARYDGKASCLDYPDLPFGGWKTAYAKQHADSPTKGGIIQKCVGASGLDVNVLC